MTALKCKKAASQNADNTQNYKIVEQVLPMFSDEINVCQLFQFNATLQRGEKGIYYDHPSIICFVAVHILLFLDRIPVRKDSCPAMHYVIILYLNQFFEAKSSYKEKSRHQR